MSDSERVAALRSVRRSSFVVRRSSFVVSRSSFVVRRSSFVVRRYLSLSLPPSVVCLDTAMLFLGVAISFCVVFFCLLFFFSRTPSLRGCGWCLRAWVRGVPSVWFTSVLPPTTRCACCSAGALALSRESCSGSTSPVKRDNSLCNGPP